MDQDNLNITSFLFTTLQIPADVTLILPDFDLNTGRKEICPGSFDRDCNNLGSTATVSSPASSSLQFDDFQDMISFILNGYLTTFCVAIGTLLNIFCIVIFLQCRHGSAPVIHYYLIALTVWQTSLLCNAFLLYSLPTLIYGRLISTGRYVYLYPYAYALANTTHTGSVWVIMALTIDRYLALCRPLSHRAIGKRSRVKRLMVAVSLLAIVYSLPRFFEIQTLCLKMDEDDNDASCLPTVARTKLTQNQTYWQLYHIILAMMFVTVAPCLLLFALTVRISLAIRKAYIRRESLCRTKRKEITTRKEHKANIMLVLVIAKFLISDIFPTVADVLEHFVGDEAFMNSASATLFVDLSNFLLVLNCSTNFWVFIIYGRRFRQSFIRIVGTTSVGSRFCQWIKLEEKKEAGPSTFTVFIGGTSSVKRRSTTFINNNNSISVEKQRLSNPTSDTGSDAPRMCKREAAVIPRTRHSSIRGDEQSFRSPLIALFSEHSNGLLCKKVLSFQAVPKTDV